jgi:ATP synthase F0 subunit c
MVVPLALLFAITVLYAQGRSANLLSIGAAYGIGRLASSALESMARQPEVAGSIQIAMIIAAALIEVALRKRESLLDAQSASPSKLSNFEGRVSAAIFGSPLRPVHHDIVHHIRISTEGEINVAVKSAGLLLEKTSI